MKILIADDNYENLYMLETLLRGNGYEVAIAHNGMEALEFLRAEAADLVISDILMPRMDGFQLCRTVRADKELMNIPLIFYTATYTDPKDVELGLSLGADRFLIKPQETESLLHTIRDVLVERLTTMPAGAHPLGQEMEFFRQYNEVLFRKLEKKMADLETANLALKESETRFRSMFEQSPVAYQAIDEAGRLLYVNGQWCQMLGYGPDELIGKSFGDFWSPETRQHFGEKLAFLTTNGHVQAELQFVRKDGEVLEVHMEGRIERDSKGAFMKAHCIFFDVTERKRFEKSLEASVLQMTAILSNIPDMAWLKDTESRFIAVNTPFAAACGRAPQELVGKSDLDIWPGDLAELYQRDDAEVMSSGLSKRVEERLIDHDGKESWIETIKTPVFDANHVVIGTTGIARDITARRRAESEKTFLQEQLRQAQKMEAIGQLAGGVAHDFNNILTAIVGYATIALMRMKEDDPGRHDIDQILASSNQASVLTQRLMAFSRKQPVNLVGVDLSEVVLKFQKLLLRLLTESIELRVIAAEQELPIVADRGQLEQVLMNLVTNARDAMPKGGRIVIETGCIRLDQAFIKAHGFGEPGEYAVLSVSDTGEGMTEDIRRRIFEPFFTTKVEGKGTGLGLAMVYGIVKQHQWSVDVYSEPGLGTTFKIYLPLDRTALKNEEQKVEERVPLRGGTETILLAEDNDLILRMLATILRKYGYTVIEAVDGIEAIAKFTENSDKVRLLVLDGIMPRMCGKEVYEEIRALNPDIKVVFISGHAEDVFTREGFVTGETAFLQKPAPPSALLRKIREVLDS